MSPTRFPVGLAALLLLGGALAGCNGKDDGTSQRAVGDDSGLSDADLGTCDASGGRQHWVIDSLAFARITEGVSEGFDLDDDASETGGAGGCGVGDVVGLDGTPGVDNAFGMLLPALETTEFVAAEGLINATIHSGELMLVTELTGVDDPANDPCVGVAMRRAVGEPLFGTDGEFLPGQTLDLDTSFVPVEMSEMALVDGSVEGKPFTATLPVQVINAAIEFELAQGAIRLDIDESGDATGVFAGALDTAQLIAIATEEGIDESVVQVLDAFMSSVADLDPDEAGNCRAVSVVLIFTATPIYIYDDVW